MFDVEQAISSIRLKQGVALKGRNTTGPPRVLPPGVAYASCYRRRQTQATGTSLAPCTMCRLASNNAVIARFDYLFENKDMET